MAKGDGSLTQLGRNHWKVRVDHGKDPITGKRQVVSRNIRGTKAEARKLRDQLRSEKESGIKANAGKTTLNELVNMWAQAKKSAGVAAPETIDGNLSRLNHVLVYLGDVPITNIDAKTIELIYSKIREERGLGGTSMNQIHSLLKSVFNKAVDYDLLLRNPCNKVVAPKKDDPGRRAMSIEECSRLATCLDKEEEAIRQLMVDKENRMAKLEKTSERSSIRGLGKLGSIHAVRLALATGMRRGEVAGLEWQHIDLENHTVSIVQSRTKYGTNKAPKSKAGIRTIYIDEFLIKSLQRWKQEQAELLGSLDIVQEESTPVCCNDMGGYLDLRNFERFWRQFRIDHGFEGWKLHELRHTQATQLLANGVDVKTVQERMGHANANITLDWYAHAVPENDKRAAEMLGSLVFSPTDHTVKK